jgi:GntR family transcriptional regulator of arabinose operon
MKIEATSKSDELKNKLLLRIRSGHYKPGAKIESVRNLASEFHLSRHTVERTLAMLATEGYVKQEQGRGTFFLGSHHPPSKAWKNKLVAFIAGISEEKSGEFVNDIMRGFCLAAYKNKFQTLVYYQEKFEDNIEGITLEDIQGLAIYYLPNVFSFEYLEQLSKKTKLLLINNYCHGLDLSHATLNNEKAGQMITDYLIAKGHRNIGFISWPALTTSIQERLTGYKISLASNNIPIDNGLISFSLKNDQTNYYNLDACVKEILKNSKKASAICINDGVAAHLCKLLRQNGIRIPEDIAVTGFGNTVLAQSLEVPLTVVENPGYDIGYMAGKIITDKNNEGQIKKVMLEPSIITRESA